MARSTSAELAQIRAFGKRVTAQRQLVLEAVQKAKHHVTAEQVLRAVRLKNPKIDTSTVYRNLEALEQARLVSHTHLNDRVIQWHRAEAARHGHLVCRLCKGEIELSEQTLQGIERRLLAQYGFRADLAHSALDGLCEACAAG
ncbi:MAG: transcriptional repressor [Candidatus Dormibacteraceae bacterium]